MKVYIAGPTSDLKQFKLMAEELKRAGFEPIYIADKENKMTAKEYTEATYKSLATCDAVFLLDNWDISEVVMSEIYFAHKHKIRIARNIYELHQIKERLKCKKKDQD